MNVLSVFSSLNTPVVNCISVTRVQFAITKPKHFTTARVVIPHLSPCEMDVLILTDQFR